VASIAIVIDPSSGQPVEIPGPTVDMGAPSPYASGPEIAQYFGTGDEASGTNAVIGQPFDDGTFSGLSEPFEFYIPPEVQAILGPGVNPFASVSPYVQSPAGAPAGSPSIVPTAPSSGGVAPAGTGGLLPGIAPLPVGQVMPELATVLPPPGGWVGIGWAMLPDWDVMPLGRVWTDDIRNRQTTGVRFGTLPMVVFSKLGSSGGYS